jgi:hypothetical protein
MNHSCEDPSADLRCVAITLGAATLGFATLVAWIAIFLIKHGQ